MSMTQKTQDSNSEGSISPLKVNKKKVTGGKVKKVSGHLKHILSSFEKKTGLESREILEGGSALLKPSAPIEDY